MTSLLVDKLFTIPFVRLWGIPLWGIWWGSNAPMQATLYLIDSFYSFNERSFHLSSTQGWLSPPVTTLGDYHLERGGLSPLITLGDYHRLERIMTYHHVHFDYYTNM